MHLCDVLGGGGGGGQHDGAGVRGGIWFLGTAIIFAVLLCIHPDCIAVTVFYADGSQKCIELAPGNDTSRGGASAEELVSEIKAILKPLQRASMTKNPLADSSALSAEPNERMRSISA